MAPQRLENGAPSRQRKTILVVEDEIIIRMDIADWLRARGYTVIEADSADEAIAVLQHSGEVSVIFTDVRMPGERDGLDLARYAQEHHPEIPVLVTSGHIIPEELPASLGPLIDKPYSRAHILSLIEDRLRRSKD